MPISGTKAGITLVPGIGQLTSDDGSIVFDPPNGDGIVVDLSVVGGGGGVNSLNGESGAVNLTSTGGSIVITTLASGTINLEVSGGSGSGSVTSVSVSGKNGITVAGSPITSAGTIDLGLGQITPTGVTTGVVSASLLNITGDIQAAAGRITVSAATISSKLSGAAAVFSGLVSADAGINTTAVSAASIGITGDMVADGRVTASAMTVNNLLTGAAATFSGIVSANAGLKATTVSASGVIGGLNLSGTNTGDQTITLTGDVSGSGTGSFSVVTTRLQGVQVKSGTPSDAQVLTYNMSASNWEAATPGAGAGTVTSVSVSGKNGITIAGSPITSAGTIDIGLGAITPTGITTGVVSASTLNVTGDIQAATGRVTVSAATINALLTGAAASFSGIVSANAGLSTTTLNASGTLTGVAATFSGAVSANAGLSSTTINASGTITGVAATFSGMVSANAGLMGTTGSFSGVVSAGAGLNTTVVSANSLNVTGDILAATGKVTASAATITSSLIASAAVFGGVVSANAGLRASSFTAGSSSNFAQFDTDGNLTLSGTANYLVATNAAAFQPAADTDGGLYFTTNTPSGYHFRDTSSGARLFAISNLGGNASHPTMRGIAYDETVVTTISADQNNYAGYSGIPLAIHASTSAHVITGIAAPSGPLSQRSWVYNNGANNIGYAHDSASSTSANRMLTPTGTTLVVSSRRLLCKQYIVAEAKWLVWIENHP